MTGAGWLVGYAVVMATFGGQALRRLTASGGCPRLGVLAWQLASWSVLVSFSAGALLIALPSTVPMDGLAHLLRVCWTALHRMASGSPSGPLQLLAVVLAAAVPLRYLTCLLTAGARMRAKRRVHGEALQVVARHDERLGAYVLPSEAPLAYCLPGHRSRIVVTRGALAELTGSQLAAVIAHERGHVRGRHHLALWAAGALATSFPRVPLFVAADSGIRRLLELCADDCAVRSHGREPLAQALAAMAGAAIPDVALGATGAATEVRIDRLRSGADRSRWPLGLTLLALTVGPGVALAMPALLQGWQVLMSCPVPALS